MPGGGLRHRDNDRPRMLVLAGRRPLGRHVPDHARNTALLACGLLEAPRNAVREVPAAAGEAPPGQAPLRVHAKPQGHGGRAVGAGAEKARTKGKEAYLQKGGGAL